MNLTKYHKENSVSRDHLRKDRVDLRKLTKTELLVKCEELGITKCKLLFQELTTMNVVPRIMTDK